MPQVNLDTSPITLTGRPLLLLPKLQLPRLPAGLIERERLFPLLDAGLDCKLTLVCAPAGFGKTTLVRQWLAARLKAGQTPGKKVKETPEGALPPFNVAWVGLDSCDNDPIRFWRYLITACQAIQPNLGQATLALLQTAIQPPFEPASLEMVLAAFLNELAQLLTPVILVLEDYHTITSPRIHQTLTFFLDHLPATFHLFILTRSNPPFPLTRLRVSHDLVEVQAPDLCFLREEVQTFLGQQVTPFPLSSEMLVRVSTRLEGWAAGLRLLGLMLQRHHSPQKIEQVFLNFTGSHRPILDYFTTEVLNTQPAPLQLFLLQTSGLRQLTGPMCDALLDRTDSAQLLAELERSGLFLEALDEAGQWYRYHTLFAEAMQQLARTRLGETTLRTITDQASRWYEQHGLLVDAIETALQTGDFERAAHLIETTMSCQSEEGYFFTLRRWLGQIPETILKQYPALCLHYATALLFVSLVGRSSPVLLAHVEGLLQMAEQCWQQQNDTAQLGRLLAVRALMAQPQGQLSRAITWARQSLAWLPASDAAWRVVSLSVIGAIEASSGQLDTARQKLLETQALAETIKKSYLARTTLRMLAQVYLGQGALHLAADHYRRVLAEAKEQADLVDMGHAQLGLAQIFYEWNDLAAAQQAAQELFDLGQYLNHEGHQAAGTLMLARIQAAQGQLHLAQQRLVMALARSTSPLLQRELLAGQARLHLMAGDLAAVQSWLTQPRPEVEPLWLMQQEQEQLIEARLLLAQGQIEPAMTLLRRLLPAAQAAGRRRNSLEIQILMARTYQVNGQGAEARSLLQSVLRQTYPEGYLRLFLDEGRDIAGLLHTLRPDIQEKPLDHYLQTLLPLFPDFKNPIPPPDLIEPLSGQERRVLRLLAAGLSNPEIAQELVVSVNTVRTQVQSIYRKLDVHNRVEASEAARRLRLL